MCAVILLAAGCNTVSRDYPGVSHDQLWQAALGAARNPKYSNLLFSESCRTTWTFSVLVDANDRVPKIVLNSRAAIRPPNFLTEADHFFGEIDSRLAQLPIDLSKPASGITTTQVADPNGLEAPSARDTSTQTIPDPAPAVANPSGVQPPLTGP